MSTRKAGGPGASNSKTPVPAARRGNVPGGAAARRGSASPSKTAGTGRQGSVSPQKARPGEKKAAGTVRPREDPKEHARKLERERETARNQVKEYCDNTLESFVLGNSDIGVSSREEIETLCREVLFWLVTTAGQSATKDDYAKALGQLQGAFQLAKEMSLKQDEEPPLPLNIFDGDQMIVSEQDRQIEAAVKNGSVEELNRLLRLQTGRNIVNSRDHKGWIPLHHAVSLGRREISQVLLRGGADINCQSHDGLAPIHIACITGHLDVVQILISNGAQLDLTSRDLFWTPLHFAASHGHLEIAQCLVNAGADINTLAKNNWTPMHLASMNGHTDLTIVLLWGKDGAGYNGANEKLPLEMKTGNGKIVVDGLLASQVASCYRHPKTSAQLAAAVLRLEDERLKKELEKRKKKAPPPEPEAQKGKGRVKAGSKSPTSRSPSRARAGQKSPTGTKSPTGSKSPLSRR